MKMSKKAKTVLAVYACAAIAVLGLCVGVGQQRLKAFRLAARYSSARAFEETVGAVNDLSRSLQKSLYATDAGMCARICSDVCADARAAEAALATLPFSTVELAEISGFLGVAGDYAYTLCGEAGEGFNEEQLTALTGLSATATEFSEKLRAMQSDINDGVITMDTHELRLQNVGEDAVKSRLSEKLNDYAKGFTAPAALRYDGKYSAQDEKTVKELSGEELAEMAADFLGVGAASLDLKYEYSQESCRRCYACRGTEVCVSPDGVLSMGTDRLVSDAVIGLDEAEKTAAQFLDEHGFTGLQLMGERQNGAVAQFDYAQLAGDALCPDKTVRVSIALDDGSVYALNAEKYDPELDEALWPEGESFTSVIKPNGLTLTEMRPVIIETPGGKDLACWEMHYRNEAGESVTVYNDAETGREREIEIE